MADLVDYSALAKQAGAVSSTPAGGVDYAALAKESGAIASSKPQPEGFWHSLYSSTLGPIIHTAAHPIDTAVDSFRQLYDTEKLHAIADQVKQGNYGKAAALGAMWATTPVATRMMQPVVDKTVDQVKSGDYAGAAGTALGTAAMLAGPVAAERIAAAAPIEAATRNPFPEGSPMFSRFEAQRAPAPAAAPSMELPSIAPESSSVPKVAAQSTAGKLQSRMQSIDWGSLKDVQKAAAEGDAHAQQVAEQLANAGDNPDHILQASINLNDWRTSQYANQLYNKVEDLADNKYQLGEVPLTQARGAVQRSIGSLEGAKLKDPATLKILREIQQNVTPKEGDTFAGNTYGRIRELVSDLGERIRMQQTGDNALIGPKGIGQLQAVKSALENDLSEFTTKSKIPELADAAKAADEYYKQVRVPFKDAGIAKAGTTTEPDTIFQNFVKAGRGDRAQKFYDALDARGQAAAQYKIVSKALNDAVDPKTGLFSNGAFASALERAKDASGVFFQGNDAAAIEGLKRLAQQAARVDMNPAASISPVMPKTAAVAPVTGPFLDRLAKVLMTTDAGREWLYSASKLKPGTPPMQNLWKTISQKLPDPRTAIVAGSEAAGSVQ